jgi:hypothetical protein
MTGGRDEREVKGDDDDAAPPPEGPGEPVVVERRLDFAFDPRYRRMLSFLGIRPDVAWACVGADLEVRFGRWHVITPVTNVSSASVAGPYVPARVLGPHLSLQDKGVTFGTNNERGVCLTFVEPVVGLDPWGWLRHPNMTVTLANPDEAVEVFRRRGVKG